MEKKEISVNQLDQVLTQVVQAVSREHPISGALFELQKNTGLRVCEVYEVERWEVTQAETYTVQLSKREGTRVINVSEVPEVLRLHYDYKKPLVMQTYSSLNNSLRRNCPVFVFNSDTRRTTSHAFRYLFAKRAFEELQSVAAVAELMGHLNQANTARYIFDKIYMYEA